MAKRSTECIAPDSCTDIFKHSSSRKNLPRSQCGSLVTEVLFFGGMFLAYTSNRSAFSTAFGIGSNTLDITLGAGNTVVLIMRSLTMAMARVVRSSWQKKWVSIFPDRHAGSWHRLSWRQGHRIQAEVRHHLVPGRGFDMKYHPTHPTPGG